MGACDLQHEGCEGPLARLWGVRLLLPITPLLFQAFPNSTNVDEDLNVVGCELAIGNFGCQGGITFGGGHG
jgi:hypothetical protein